jgi:hypothetical protein
MDTAPDDAALGAQMTALAQMMAATMRAEGDTRQLLMLALEQQGAGMMNERSEHGSRSPHN